jgi:hypothetical protein
MSKNKQMTRKHETNPRTSSTSESNYNESDDLNVDPALVDNLEKDTQETLLKTFEYFYEQESETMIQALSQSRDLIKCSMVDLVDEQDKMKEKLAKVSEGKYEYRRKAGK